MSALSEKEKLQREIAKLSATINRSSSATPSTAYPGKQRHAPTSYVHKAPYPRNNPAQVVGGRHRSLVLDNRNGHGAASSATTLRTFTTLPPTNGGSASSANNASAAAAANGMSVPQATTSGALALTATETSLSSASTTAGDTKMVYVNRTTKKGNMSMVKPELYGKFEKARLNRSVKTASDKANKAAGKRSQMGRRSYNSQLSSANGGKSVAKRVVIDGVTYEFEADGVTLKKVEDTFQTKQRKRKLDNRDGSQAKKKIKRTETHCRFFTKTGTCLRANRCPYVHDPHRIAICSRFLRNKCPLTAETCPLSHQPSPHNTPSCAHFQRNGFCRDGDDCLYPHVKVADDAPVCVAFSTEGWCDKGSTCEERHAWECREYSEKGVCSRGSKCGLAHVLKAKTPADVVAIAAIDLSDDDSNVHGTKVKPHVQPDDVEPPLSGMAPISETTVGVEQQVAQNKVPQETEGTSTGNDFERQEDFIQFADIGEDEDEGEVDEEDETEEDGSDEGDEDTAMGSGVEAEGDQQIKYTFGESSEERSEDDADEVAS